MPVTFNGVSLIPAPLINVQEQIHRLEDGHIGRVGYIITLNGTIVNVDTSVDSPNASSYTTMDGILAAQSGIRNTFNVDAGILVISSPDGNGYGSVTIQARPQGITFGEGVWVNKDAYTISLIADQLSDDTFNFNGTKDLDAINETYNVNENDDGTYLVSHNISAKGALLYNGSFNNPMVAARNWVKSRSFVTDINGSLSPAMAGSGVMNLSFLVNPIASGTNYWNRSVVQVEDPIQYTVNLTENFLYNPSGSSLEKFSVNLNYQDGNPYKVSAVINGKIDGMADDIKNVPLRFSNAKTKFFTVVEPGLYSRITDYLPSGFVANPTPQTKSVVEEVTGGSIAYNYTFIADSGGTLINGALQEEIIVTSTGPQDIVAQIPVPGRSKGPIFQYMKTQSAPRRSVNITAIMAPSGNPNTINSLVSLWNSKPDTSAIIQAFTPSSGYYYVDADQEEWNGIRRTYGRTVSWIIDTLGSHITNIPSGIHFVNPSG